VSAESYQEDRSSRLALYFERHVGKTNHGCSHMANRSLKRGPAHVSRRVPCLQVPHTEMLDQPGLTHCAKPYIDVAHLAWIVLHAGCPVDHVSVHPHILAACTTNLLRHEKVLTGFSSSASSDPSLLTGAMGSANSMPANYSAAAYGVLTIEIILTIAVVCGRIVSRRMMKATTAMDDHLCYLAFVSLSHGFAAPRLTMQTANLGLLISGLFLTRVGAIDLHRLLSQSEQGNRSLDSAAISFLTLYFLAITLIKLSILFFYRNTFTMLEKWFRWCWWLLLGFVLLWTGTCLSLLILYTTETVKNDGFGRLAIAITGIINGVSDLILVILPAVRISSMKMHRKQKFALISIFAIGGL
jgi:hypothetical protein